MIIVAIGFYVVQWDAGVWPKFLAIVLASTVATALVYEFLVRHSNGLRFLFGMKPRPRAESARRATAEGSVV